jgi:hypothetical protein
MVLVRILLIMAFGSGLGCYALFMLTGQLRWKQRAYRMVLGTLALVVLFGLLLWASTLAGS